jgi:member of the syntaxin family of t-SNAREs
VYPKDLTAAVILWQICSPRIHSSKSKRTRLHLPNIAIFTTNTSPYRDVQTTLRTTRPLFSSYLRIRTLATSATSPELQQSRSELLATLENLSTDLADLVDSVQAVEHDPYRFGLDVDEVARRRRFVQDVGGEVGSMRKELDETVENAANIGANGRLPNPGSFEDERDGDDPYGEFEAQQQVEMMHEQDEQLDGVFKTVGVLRGQAEDMGRELEEQGHMLDEVDTLADRVGGKLQNGVKKVGYIIKKNEGEYYGEQLDL